MSKNWLAERKQDKYYRKAKESGYRSRASYKLIFIQEKFNIFREGNTVLDLGAAPGGWSQVAREFIGGRGTVIEVDLQVIQPIPGMQFIRGDINDAETLDLIAGKLNGRAVDVVLSDMAPNISGNYSMDHARSVSLCERALDIAVIFRAKVIVFKIFQGDLYDDFIQKVKRHYRSCKAYKSKASRDESSEIYIVGKGFIS